MRGGIAWRNLTRERTRLAISAGGVAFAVLLILLLRGLYSGFLDQATEYVRSVDADLWVAQAGTPGDFSHSVSLQPADRAAQIRSVESVRRVTPLLGRRVRLGSNGGGSGGHVDVYLLGIDPATGVGGPPAMEQGRRIPGRGEIVVDRVLAQNQGLEVGDSVDVGGVELRIVGIARGGNTIVSQFAWATAKDAEQALGLTDIVNYFLVSTQGSPRTAADAITRSVEGTRVFTKAEFAEANTEIITESFLPIILVLVVIAFAIGTAVIGLTIYTATLEKRREYGVLKAIGFSNRRLYGVVWQQTFIASAIGLVLGAVLTWGVASLVEGLLPSFVVTLGAGDVALVAAVSAGMALVASFLPMRPVARLDPAQVFRV
ncbi:MAG: FtsX-like permease family protein [Chloroflexota bacterium]